MNLFAIIINSEMHYFVDENNTRKNQALDEYSSEQTFRAYSGMISVSCTVFFSILYFMGITHFLINGSSGIQSRSAMCASISANPFGSRI